MSTVFCMCVHVRRKNTLRTWLRTPVSRRSAKAPPSAGGSADSCDFSMVSDNRKDRARRTRVPASAQGSESLPDGSDNKFTFGQHVGLSYHEVLHKYPLVITYGEKSRSHLARVWLTFWIGPLRTRRLTVNPMKSFHACCLWKKLRLLHGQVMPPNPPLSKCGKCTRFTALGSNAYIQVKTCLDCGHQTRIKREQVYAE